MSQGSPLERQIAHIIRDSEVRAVVRALKSGATVRVGQSVEYYIEPQAAGILIRGPRSTGKPYRTAIEQWHLDAAIQMIRQGSSL